MAEPTSGLGVDPTKMPIYGTTEEQQQKYHQTLEDQIKALENRYAQPNWFKVAAGFAKPQLGGFMASLGSASEALGENVEQQRAAALPISQMRAQLAQSEMIMGSGKTQSDEFKAWQASGKPMDQATYTRLVGLNPTSPIAEAAKAAYEGQRKDLEYTSGQQRLMMDAITMKQAKNRPLSKAEQDFLDNLPGQLSLRQEAKPLLPGGAPVGAEGPAKSNEPVGKFDLSKPGAIEAIKQSINKIADPVERDRAMQAFNSQVNPSQSTATPLAAPAEPKKPEEPVVYPVTFKPPQTSGMGDADRAVAMDQYRENMKTAEARSEDQVNRWRTVASEPNYVALDSEYKSAINLIKSHPQMAKKVFNQLRGNGDLINQAATAAQAGLGVSFGSMAAQLNIPVNAWQSAGLNREEQMLADSLVRSMLVVGNAKLASQGITPEKGQQSYQDILANTKASLAQNPATALHNLLKDYEMLKQNKKLYDTVTEEHFNQQPHSSTPYTDVLRHSKRLKKINEDTAEEISKQSQIYSAALEEMRKKREAASGR